LPAFSLICRPLVVCLVAGAACHKEPALAPATALASETRDADAPIHGLFGWQPGVQMDVAGVAVRADAEMVVLTTILQAEDRMLRSVVRAMESASSREAWIRTFSDFVVGPPSIGESGDVVVIPAGRLARAGQKSVPSSHLIVLDLGTGETVRLCPLDDFEDGERVAHAFATEGGGYVAISNRARVCHYPREACGTGKCVQLQFDDARGGVVAPESWSDAMTLAPDRMVHWVYWAARTYEIRHLDPPRLGPLGDRPSCVVALQGATIAEYREEQQLYESTTPVRAVTVGSTGACGGPVAVVSEQGEIWLRIGEKWYRVRP